MTIRRVLIIEDSPTDVLLFREAISECDIEVVVDIVPTWPDAYELLNDGSLLFSLILLDLNLPIIGGKEIVHLIREGGMYVPIVVLSTSSSSVDIHSCYKAGVNGYVVKPYDIEQLFDVMCITFKWWLEVNKLVDERYE
ncbi:response regulator receiver domain protein [Microcoleus phage My-WqHQDG]|nr:response regulator receiver domain protein [Microcoleus phage My-WqHQDG]